MLKTISYILITIISLSFVCDVAFAKRFGGGRSFGHQRSYSAPSKSSHNSAKAKSPSKASKWMGPLAGLAVGGLLASLFMGHGLGAGIMSWLLIAAVIFLIFRVISNMRSQNNMSYEADNGRVIPGTQFQNKQDSSFSDKQSAFDKDDFLRGAKAAFIRMQTAYDNKNLADIREFTTPEVFAEVQLQIQERGDKKNVTEVLHIDAELTEGLYDVNQKTASVKFQGSIREEENQEPVSINEIWHFEKDTYSDNWMISGLQQG